MNGFSMRKLAEHRRVLAEAYDLADRFPELQDEDVIEHVNYVFGKRINEESVLGKACLIAYAQQDMDAALNYLTALR